MTNITPIRRPAPVSNLRPISDPRVTADAMCAALASIAAERPAGLCETRWRILSCIAAHPQGEPSRAALRLCARLSDKALSEHLQALRWKGLILFESIRLSPSAEAMTGAEATRPVNWTDGAQTAGAALCAPAPAPLDREAPAFEEDGAAVADPNPSGRAAVRAADPAPAPLFSIPLFPTRKTRLVDLFADHLARGKTPEQAAGAMGYDASFARRMMERINRDAGGDAL